MENSERDVVYELGGQLFVWDRIKAEYDFTKLKRAKHPMQAKIDRGEVKLTSILDIPNREEKLAALDPDERAFVLELFERRAARGFKFASN